MESEKGWSPMPTSLKVIWIILILSAFQSFQRLFGLILSFFINVPNPPITNIIPFEKPVLSLLITIIFVVQIVLIIYIFRRAWWSWRLGIGYFCYNLIALIVSSIITFSKVSEIENILTGGLNYISLPDKFITIILSVNVVFLFAITTFLLILYWKNRGYFESER